MEKARSMLNDASLSQDYWEKVVGMACYAMNRSSTSALVGKTPYEALDGKNTSIAHFIVFGCDALEYISKEKKKKDQQQVK